MTTTTIDEYLKDFRDNIEYVAKVFGRGITSTELDNLVVKQSEAVQDVLDNGLDIGGIMEFIVPVMSLKKHETRGWMYETSKGLFEIEFK